MVQYEQQSKPEVTERPRTSSRWLTPEQLKKVGFVGFVGCVIFAFLVSGWNAYSVVTGASFDGWTPTVMIVEFIHAAAYALMFSVLVAASVRFDIGFGLLGRVLVGLLAVLLLWAAIDSVIWWLLPRSWYPADTGAFVYFLAIHLFMATIVGIVLWRTPGVSRLATGLLLVVTPMFIAPAVLMEFGLPTLTAAGFEVPLILGVAVLGYQLWKDTESETETAGMAETTGAGV